jgi:NDP-sugar pyrophosphorylase family protein
VLNLHHRPETICAVVGDGSDLGVRARYSWENRILGSAGGPRRALPLLDARRFFLVNGDTLTDLDPTALAAAHHRSGALVTMAVVPNTEPGRYGGVLMESQGDVTGFVGRGSTKPSWHFIGVQVAEHDAFAGLPDHEPAESVGSVYPRLIRERPGSVQAVAVNAAFSDIGTPADYLATSLAFAGGAADAPLSLPSILAGARATVAPSASLVRTILWDDVEVGEDASLSECVVADGVRVPPGVRWTRLAVVRAGCCAPGGGDQRVGALLLSPLDR